LEKFGPKRHDTSGDQHMAMIELRNFGRTVFIALYVVSAITNNVMIFQRLTRTSVHHDGMQLFRSLGASKEDNDRPLKRMDDGKHYDVLDWVDLLQGGISNEKFEENFIHYLAIGI
jgi:hypothetical protein